MPRGKIGRSATIGAMKATLFVMPGSHPSMAARLMLERKGIDYRRIDLVPVLSKGILRLAGFAGVTVPALRLDGEQIQGTGAIARALDAAAPEPPLLPRDPADRAEVEAAERWGDETPDVVSIFRRPLCEMSNDIDELVHEVYVTVVHEIAHAAGIDDDRLHELGWA